MTVACLALRHIIALWALSIYEACQFCSHIPIVHLVCLLVLTCTCCCRGFIHDHQILLVGTVRSGYIKEIRRDQPLERDRLWLTSSETGGGPLGKNKGEITIYKTFIFHFIFRRDSSNSFKLPPSPVQSAKTTQHQYIMYNNKLRIVGLNRSSKSHKGQNNKAWDVVVLCHRVWKSANSKEEGEAWVRCYKLVEKLLKLWWVLCTFLLYIKQWKHKTSAFLFVYCKTNI